jgi:hypothetical protein
MAGISKATYTAMIQSMTNLSPDQKAELIGAFGNGTGSEILLSLKGIVSEMDAALNPPPVEAEDGTTTRPAPNVERALKAALSLANYSAKARKALETDFGYVGERGRAPSA